MEVGQIAKNRVALYRDNSITTNNSIELPAEIDNLIDNKMYRNKFKKLVREGKLNELLELAEIAATKDKPSFWFAKVTSKARIEGTLEWLRKAREVAHNAAEVVRRLVPTIKQMKAVYKACWSSPDVIRHAITAEETGRDKFKYFCWLVWGKYGNSCIH
jgi:hypothetical protein